jgi:hypothetical protein
MRSSQRSAWDETFGQLLNYSLGSQADQYNCLQK